MAWKALIYGGRASKDGLMKENIHPTSMQTRPSSDGLTVGHTGTYSGACAAVQFGDYEVGGNQK